MTRQISRRQTLAILGGSVTLTLHSTPVQAQAKILSDDERVKLESRLTSLFGSDEPIPTGIKPESNADEGSLVDQISPFSLPFGEEDDRSNRDRDQLTSVDIADTTCETCDIVQDLPGVATEVSDREREFTRETFRAQHILAILAEKGMVRTFDPDDIVAVRESVPTWIRFLPLIGSANNVVKMACAVDESKPDTVIDFYLAVAAFCIEVAFFQFGIGYKLAFRGTNVLATSATFARLHRYTGSKMYGLVLSEIHWALREGLSKGAGVVTANTLVFARGITQKLNEEQRGGTVAGVPETIDVSRAELAEVLCESQSNVDWFESLFGQPSTSTSELDGRLDAITQGVCDR